MINSRLLHSPHPIVRPLEPAAVTGDVATSTRMVAEFAYRDLPDQRLTKRFALFVRQNSKTGIESCSSAWLRYLAQKIALIAPFLGESCN